LATGAALALPLLLLASSAVRRRPAADGPFEGLDAALARNANGEGAIRLLVVHGMGNHKSGYAASLMEGLSGQLGLVVDDRAGTSEPIEKDGFSYGTIRQASYLDGTGRLRLRLYELTWTPTVVGLKKQAFLDGEFLAKKRALVNQELKSGLMDERFPDAILYAGCYREHMQYPVMRAIQFIERDGLTADDELAFITHSLGSRMTFETLNDMRNDKSILGVVDDNGSIAESVSLRTKYFFMLANQLPLFVLSDVINPKGEGRRALKEFLQFQSEARSRVLSLNKSAKEEPAVHVIAFSDPNDLLSYPINEEDVLDGQPPDSPEVVVRNVRISVAKWGIPFLLADPLTAHTGYLTDSRTAEMIVKGRK